MSIYERWVLPRFINCACGTKPIMRQRAKVVPEAEGTVLEIGIGTGLNLRHYPEGVTKLSTVDPMDALQEKVADSPVWMLKSEKLW